MRNLKEIVEGKETLDFKHNYMDVLTYQSAN